MVSELEKFRQQGYLVVDGLVGADAVDELIDCVSGEENVGSRNLLQLGPVRVAACGIRECDQLEGLLEHFVTVQCTSFIKSQSKNWAVRLHRDRVIPARGGHGWKTSGVKDGIQFVRPPREVLAALVAVRLNLDDAVEGDLQVVPASHANTGKSERCEAVAVPVKKGGALIMRPLLEHASTKLRHSRTRRVLHFLFGPRELPCGYRWHQAV